MSIAESVWWGFLFIGAVGVLAWCIHEDISLVKTFLSPKEKSHTKGVRKVLIYGILCILLGSTYFYAWTGTGWVLLGGAVCFILVEHLVKRK